MLSNKKIEMLARQGRLFEYLYKQPYQERLIRADKWVCMHCGHCCSSSYCVSILILPEGHIIPKKVTEEDIKSIIPYIVHLDQTKGACPHLIGDTPGNMMCAIHKVNKAYNTMCYRHTPGKDMRMHCVEGMIQIHKLDEDYDKAIQEFRKGLKWM